MQSMAQIYMIFLLKPLRDIKKYQKPLYTNGSEKEIVIPLAKHVKNFYAKYATNNIRR